MSHELQQILDENQELLRIIEKCAKHTNEITDLLVRIQGIVFNLATRVEQLEREVGA